jgi:hypothetical protein
MRLTSQAIDRRERLRRLALETIDLAKDPYYMRNHLGQIECRLCLTLHPNEGNYLAHTQVRPACLHACMHACARMHSTPPLSDSVHSSHACVHALDHRASGISRTLQSARQEKQLRSLRHPRQLARPT